MNPINTHSCDFVVVEALGDEPENLQLPRGECGHLPLLGDVVGDFLGTPSECLEFVLGYFAPQLIRQKPY